MLVTFSTKYHADIIMLGDVGLAMLKMMGQSDTVPSAILADDVPVALDKLQTALSLVEEDTASESDEKDTKVNISKRALPLIELLNTAIKHASDVMWK